MRIRIAAPRFLIPGERPAQQADAFNRPPAGLRVSEQ